MSSCIIHLITAARPNFMKVAPAYHALRRETWCDVKLIHTGQHHDANMSDVFLQDLRLPSPDFHLNIGSGTHAEQTAGVMVAYERLCLHQQRPDWIIVVGDVNSTVACALVGAKLGISVAHLEAGLRSRDRRMPEEINRLITDAIADLLWTPSPDGDENLLSEGVPAHKIDRIGNIMIDCFEMLRGKIEQADTRAKLGLEARDYAVVTLHRPSNVDDATTLSMLVEQIRQAAQLLPLVFVVHPRTRKRLDEFGLAATLDNMKNVRLTEPLGYIQFMNLVRSAGMVITDSGGIQEESTYLDIPCLTLRDSTERPITLSQGSNRLVPPELLLDNVKAVLSGDWPHGRAPEFWDGNTAARLVQSLKLRVLAGASPCSAAR